MKSTKYAVLSLSALICSVFLVVTGTDDPCSTTKYLNDWRRSVAFTVDEVQLCDNILEEGWYRIISGQGDKMPTECPEGGFRCNTAIPVWLSNDTITTGEDIFPDEGDVVNRTAYGSHYSGVCERHAYKIRIKGCTGFFVYYLVPTTTCSSAYCFGDTQPCASGTNSDTGFTPDCGVYPKLSISPFVTPSLEEEDVMLLTYSKVIFACHANELKPNYTYDVRWYINDLEIIEAKTTNLTKTNVDDGLGKMKEVAWTSKFRPNFIVNCSIQVKGVGYGLPSPEHHSEQFFAGIEVQQDTYIVNENVEIVIPVRLTIPLACNWGKHSNDTWKRIHQKQCVLNLLTGLPNYQTSLLQCQNGISDTGLVFGHQKCGIAFNFSHWNEIKYLKLTGAADNLVNLKDRLVFLRLYNEMRHVEPNQDSLFMWNGIVLPDIKVTIHDTDQLISGKGCWSLNDPHMYSFDGSRNWELQQNIGEGEYIMYLHNRLPLQINAYFRKCNPSRYALCNCGLAVRSGDSVFVANFCETIHVDERNGISERKLNRYAIQRLCDDQSLIVTENGNTIEVILPTGTKVRFSHGQVYRFYGIHGIYIYPTSLDRDLTNGLCGIYNGDPIDDFVPRGESSPSDSVTFAKSWKVSGNHLLEEYRLFDQSGYLRQATYYAQEYCTCRINDEIYPHESPLYNCNLTLPMETCRNTTKTKSVITASCANKSLRVRRSFGSHITKESTEGGDDVPPAYAMVSAIEPNYDAVEWINGWTEDSARDFCTLNIKRSPAYLPCSEFVPDSNPESIIEMCVLDIKLEGDTGWMESTLQNFADSCLQQARRMENLTVTNSTSSNGETKSIFSIIAESTCPGNCSERGICENGICNCTTGYYGPACSMDKSHLPSVVADAFEGNCNTQNRPCKKFIIPGNDFINDTLTCRFSQFSMQQNGPKISFVTDDTFIHPGIYSSAFLMYCELPLSRRKKSVENTTDLIGYNISVSNNGVDFTDELTTIIYDPLCYECNLTSITCVELDTCSSKTKEPSVESKLSTWVIVLVVLSSIVLVISIGFFCVRKNIRFGKQVPYVTDSNVALPNRYGRAQSIPPTKHDDIFLAAQSRYNTEL